MSKVYRRCCGMDVHKDTVVVCVLPPDGEEGEKVRKVFGTFRNELSRMRGWMKLKKITHIAMESTGVYWMPVWNVLDGHSFELLLVNPAQVKALQGRKSDQRDAQRIAEFLQDRRLDGSFVPPREIRQLRQMLRHRQSLLEQRNEVHNQIRDLLETANIKLSSVATDLMGVTGSAILHALADGLDSPERLSWKARGRLRKQEAKIKEAMKGFTDEFFRWMLKSHLKQYDFFTEHIALFEGQIETHMEPYAEQIELLTTISGVEKLVAWNLIAEMGADMSVFPTAAHCASWAGLAPGTHESAGKQMTGRTKRGNRTLRRILTQSAWANTRCKHGYLKAFFLRIRARSGWSKAIVATAHKILVIAYGILKNKLPYQDLGDDYYDRLHPDRTLRRVQSRMAKLGYQVTFAPMPEPTVQTT
jgi:transposase